MVSGVSLVEGRAEPALMPPRACPPEESQQKYQRCTGQEDCRRFRRVRYRYSVLIEEGRIRTRRAPANAVDRDRQTHGHRKDVEWDTD
jgi:hypothetical protein